MGNSYRDLLVWQNARDYAIKVYRATERFPKAEQFGLTNQIRRAAVSVASNIAEGQGRLTPGEFIQFLGIARGSLLELWTQFEIAYGLGYLSRVDFEELDYEANGLLGLLNRLINSLRKRTSRPESS
ncbi:MAG TPA: four helix bundle protein [Candidatus Acidoferrales bacterium]|nr:four helix bundle protein [Candidatus Acidoferrales bacterium]